MSRLRYALINAIETVLRMFPLPCRTGIQKIGTPGRHSPVLLTCNYHLTVERVKAALHGVDCYLLVANSRGVNVWCAATGGLFTYHDVISALKTSGIEALVDHREVVLPQLAATGVEARTVRDKAGWKVIWGPVYARDIPAFLGSNGHKTPEMRQVAFSWTHRMEMAVAWAFPISVLVTLILAPFWRGAILPSVLLIWALSISIFAAFPAYSHLLGSEGRRVGPVLVSFERGGIELLLWGICLAGLILFGALSRRLTWGWFLRWGLVTLVIAIILSIDLSGSTPSYKSSLQDERTFRVSLDASRCKGAGVCAQVCPRDCFVVDSERHTAEIRRAERCVRCGSCIVQCPFDALCFITPKGETVAPDTIRKFKLNLMGKRLERG